MTSPETLPETLCGFPFGRQVRPSPKKPEEQEQQKPPPPGASWQVAELWQREAPPPEQLSALVGSNP